jgi:CDP-diacylglycerol--glycerol-3-phosphate 3-phosphatidyltransferase
MTTANKITVARILMIPAFVTLAIYYGKSIEEHEPVEWLRFAAIMVFLIAAFSDGLDGYIARRYKQRSELGTILDPIADKGLLLSGIITLSISNWSEESDYARFPIWFPVIVIGRDVILVVGAFILHMLIGDKMRVKPHWTGKVATVGQMCAIAWVMLQLRFLPLIFVVTVASAFTVVSGVVYVMNGVHQLQAAGHAHPKKD